MLTVFYFAAATTGAGTTLAGLAQAVVTLLAGVLGWALLGGLMVGGLICWSSRRHGAFMIDVAAAVLLAFFIFNTAGVQGILQNAAKSL